MLPVSGALIKPPRWHHLAIKIEVKNKNQLPGEVFTLSAVLKGGGGRRHGGAGGGPGSQLSGLWGVDPLQREGHAGVGAPLWRGAYGGGSRPSVSLCGRRSLRGSVTGRVCVWEGRLSILSQGDQHWPPEVRPWAGPWRVGQPGQLPRGRGVPGRGGGRGWCRGPGVWGGQGSAGPPCVLWAGSGRGCICCLAWGQLEVAFP